MDKKVELAEQMLAEYEQVEANMASPEVLKSPAKMKSVGRRYAELGRVIRVYRQYKAAAEDLAEAKEIVEDLATFIRDSLRRGYKLPLLGLGKLYVRESKARTGRNPQTGETVQIPARKRVRFSAAKALKEAVLR